MSISAGFWSLAAAISPATLPIQSAPQPVVPPAAPPPSLALDAMVSSVLVLWLLLAGVVLRRWRVWRAQSIVGPRRTGSRETVWTQIFIFLYGLFGGSLVAILVGRLVHGTSETRAIALTTAAEGVAWLIMVTATARLRPEGLRRLGLSLGKVLPGMGVGLLGIVVVFPVVAATSEVSGLYLQWTGRPAPAPHEVLQSLLDPQSRWAAAFSVLVAVVVAPLFEELAFRGFLQTVLGRAFEWFWGETGGARWAAVVLTAMAFAAVHGVPAFAPALFVLAVGLGYVYERTGNLWATITMHATFNALQIVLFLVVARH